MAIELELESEVEVDMVVVDNDEALDDDTDDQAEFAQEVAETFAAAGILAEELPATTPTTEPSLAEKLTTDAPTHPQTPAAPLTADIDSSALDLLTQISNAELRCKRAEWVVIERKEALKEAKEEFDGCVAELRKIAAQAANDSKRPLFDSRVAVTPTIKNVVADMTDIVNDESATPDERKRAEYTIEEAMESTPTTPTIIPLAARDWGDTPIDELDDLSPATLEALRRGDIATLGELSDLIARCDGASSDYWPKGIGKKKQQQIIESLLLWKENNGELGTTDTTTVPVTLPTWEALSIEEQQVYLEQRRELLTGKTCAELDALYPVYHPQHGTFAQGKEDQSNDDLLINCPCSPDTNGDWSFVDAWIAGWLWGDRQLDGSSEDAAG